MERPATVYSVQHTHGIRGEGKEGTRIWHVENEYTQPNEKLRGKKEERNYPSKEWGLE